MCVLCGVCIVVFVLCGVCIVCLCLYVCIVLRVGNSIIQLRGTHTQCRPIGYGCGTSMPAGSPHPPSVSMSTPVHAEGYNISS